MIDTLEPRACFRWFAAISAIPRGSHNERAVSDFLLDFAAQRGLAAVRDASLNVCVSKPGCLGGEHAPPVILQGHTDMVCVKEEGSSVDFARDPIRLIVEGDTLRADGTTLGADNGIALAYILALLDSADIPHPPLETVFTAEEEVGMSGAHGLDMGGLSASAIINLDSEDEGVFCVSCAGGRRSRVSLPLERLAVPEWTAAWELSVSGLAGGHSGMEIDKQRGNAIRLMGRSLAVLVREYPIHVHSLAGGTASNVIPSECRAVFLTPTDKKDIMRAIDGLRAAFASELSASDGQGLRLEMSLAEMPETVWSRSTLDRALDLIALLPDGVQSMDLNLKEQRLVESSSNIGVAATTDEALVLDSLTRSSMGSRKEFVCGQIEAVARLTGATATFMGDYPAWEYNPDSRLRDLFLQAYQDLTGSPARVEGIHAGLECGIFADKLRSLGRVPDIIALGPDIRGAHTVRERVSISSVGRTWELLKKAMAMLVRQ